MSASLSDAYVQKKPANQEKKYAGSASCASCHNEIYKNHIQTAHYLDSRPASREFIKGSFAPGKNKFVYNKWMEVALQQKEEGFFQTALINGIEMQSEPFDVVIGSGRKGQTYLFWNEDKLYQLPVSYYTPLNSWCNSPGYPTNFIKFDRIIPAQCLECHGTYAEVLEDKDNISTYDKSKMIYGIDCERCHGPAAEHVAFHQKEPNEKKGRFIINTKTMDRQIRLDACALCHSGFRDPIQPAFRFMAGDKLDDFSSVRYNKDSTSTLDVHGNQYGLLTSSKCFVMTAQMDCSSCHNVHENEFNKPKIFSQRCMDCHNKTEQHGCTVKPSNGLILSNNCIDCHMPELPSEKITLNVANEDKKVPDLVRTHRVAVYKQQSREYIEKLKAAIK
ncbi:MAG: multiheme c-type cytochrome [Chitinophagaceae bacterium]